MISSAGTQYDSRLANQAGGTAVADTLTTKAQRLAGISARIENMVQELTARIIFIPPSPELSKAMPPDSGHAQQCLEATEERLTRTEEALSSLLTRV